MASQKMEIPKEFICFITGKIMWDPVINTLGETHSRMEYDDIKSIPNIALRNIIRKWVKSHPDVPGVYQEYPVYEIGVGTPWAFNRKGIIRCGSWEYPSSKDGRRLVPLIKSAGQNNDSNPNRGLIAVEKFSISTVAVLDIAQTPSGSKSYILITQEEASPPTCRGLYSFIGTTTPANILEAAKIPMVGRQAVTAISKLPECYINVVAMQLVPDNITEYYKRLASSEPAGKIIKKRK